MSSSARPLPPGMNSIRTVDVCLQSLMIGHSFLILLILLLVALFYYSTSYGRRQPIFILNVLVLSLAVIAGVTSDALSIHTILSPQDLWPARLQFAVGFIGVFQAMLVDTILLVRLITVHPLSRIGPVRFVLLVFFPMALKVIRVVNAILFINQMSAIATGPNAFEQLNTAWITLPYVKIDWVAQMVDNSYSSIAFLCTIHRLRADITSQSLITALSFRQSSLTQRVRILFNIALSNFVIPTIMSIVQLVLVFRVGAANPILLNDVAFVNSMTSVVGVVFATVWAGKEHRREADMSGNLDFQEAREAHRTPGLEGWVVSRPHVSEGDKAASLHEVAV